MTSTTQKIANNNRTELAAESFIHMRRLLASAVSTITHLRDLVPETAYNDRYFYDMPLKILSNKNGDQCSATKIIDWMNGAFQAIKAKYLKEMRLMILLDNNDITSAIEEYIFDFDYPNGDVTSTLSMNKNKEGSNKIDVGSTQNTLRDIKKFMRDLFLLSQSLEDLPKHVYITMRLEYNENAPEGYQPDGYKDNDPNENEYLTSHKLDECNVGSLNFGYHSVKLTAGKKNQTTLNVEMTEHSEGFRVPQDSLQETCSKKITMDDDDIRCPCGYNNDINNVYGIRCGICSFWQHAVCFCCTNENDCPSFHVCHNCANVNDQNRLPTDFTLMGKTAEQLIFTCTWRRAILAAMEVDKLTVLNLRKLINSKKVIAKKIMDEFQQRNVFRPTSSEKKMKEIDKVKLADLFLHEITEIFAMNKQKRHDMLRAFDNNSQMESQPASEDIISTEETPMKYDSNSMGMETTHELVMDTRPRKQIFASMDTIGTPSQEQFKPTKRKRGAPRGNKSGHIKRSKKA